MHVFVQQQAAVPPTAFCHQDSRGEYAGGMKLHGFHISQGGNVGFQRDGCAYSLVDDRIGRATINSAKASGGNTGRLGDIGHQLAANEVANDGAVTPAIGMDQGNGLGSFVYWNILGYGLIAYGIQHGVAGTISHVIGAPFFGAAKIPGVDEAVSVLFFREGYPLAIDNNLMVAAFNAVPGHTPGGQFSHRFGCCVDEHTHHILIGTPVAAAYGIRKMHIFVVPFTLEAVG